MIDAKDNIEPELVCDQCGGQVVKLCDSDYFCLTCKEHCEVHKYYGGEDE